MTVLRACLFRLRRQIRTESVLSEPSAHLTYLLLSFLYTSSHIYLGQARRRRGADAQGLQVGAGKHWWGRNEEDALAGAVLGTVSIPRGNQLVWQVASAGSW